MNIKGFTSRPLLSGFVAISSGLILLLATPVVAQNKQLILQTQPDPTAIELTGSLDVNADGDIVATPVDPAACTATGSCEGVAVDINSFTANNQATSVSVAQGSGLTFRWTTRGAYACDGSGLTGWTGTGKLPSNTAGETISTSALNPGNYTAGLACYNGSVVADPSQSVDVEIVEDSNPPPQGCETRTISSNWNRMTNGANNCSYLYGVNGNGLDSDDDCRWFGKTETRGGVWPFEWDEQTSFQKVLGVPSSSNGRHYIALEFNSGNLTPGEEKRININQPQTSNLENRRKIVTISRCPGDFNQQEIEAEMGPGCVLPTFTDNFSWGDASFSSDFFTCGLQSNTRYYLNIIFTNSGPGGDPDNWTGNCDNLAGCGSRFTPSG